MILNSKVKVFIKLPALKEAMNIKINPQDSDVDIVFNKNSNFLELKILPSAEDFEIKICASEISVFKKQNNSNVQNTEYNTENILLPIIEPLTENEIEALTQATEKIKNNSEKLATVEPESKFLFQKLNEPNLSVFEAEKNSEVYNFENNTLPVLDNIVEALNKVIKKEEADSRQKEEILKEESSFRAMEAFKNFSLKKEEPSLNESEVLHKNLNEEVSGETIYLTENNSEFESFVDNFLEKNVEKEKNFQDISVETIYDTNVWVENLNNKKYEFINKADNEPLAKESLISERLNIANETFQETRLEVLDINENGNVSFEEEDTGLMPRTFLSIETASSFEEENKTIIMEKIDDNFIFNEMNYVFTEDLTAGEDFDINCLQIWEENKDECKFKNSWKEVKVLDLDIENINVKKNS